jgi:FkbM family methyltransferase
MRRNSSGGKAFGCERHPPIVNLRHAVDVLRRHPRPARLVLARALAWSGLSPLLSIQQAGYRLRFYPTNLSANLWINAGARVHSLDLFRDYPRAGDTMIDVGANIGEVSILASQRVGPSGQVYAFEAHPRIVSYLRGNLALNGCNNVTVRNVALGRAAGTVRFADDVRDDMNRIVDGGPLQVACTTLDDEMTAATQPVALVKVDVEGSELHVLEGARTVLPRVECVSCEMGEAHYRRYGYGMGDLIAFLGRCGFQTFVQAEPRTLRRIDPAFNEPGGHELVAVRRPEEFVARTGWRLR